MEVTFVLGETAVGKSSWALRWALDQKAAIINGDSLQVYKYLDIGTAKPSIDERELCPHFLYDFVEPQSKYTAGMYRRDALKTLAQLSDSGFSQVFIVGGSGFYFQALEKGMFQVPEVSAEVKKKVQDIKNQTSDFYACLEDVDPEYAEKIKPNDTYRIQRGLEIFYTHNQSVVKVQNEFESQREEFPYPLKKMGLTIDKDQLKKRVTLRVEKMINMGLVDEVKGLAQQGLSSWEPLQCVGYKEVLAYLNGEYNFDEMKKWIIIHTMQLAKKQRTWFKRQNDIKWYNVISDEQDLKEVKF